jgi:hypothetical protein
VPEDVETVALQPIGDDPTTAVAGCGRVAQLAAVALGELDPP